MIVEDFERLLTAFYEGTATDAEERLLREAFLSDKVPAHLLGEKKLFLSLCTRDAETVKLPASLEEKIAGLIDAKAEEKRIRPLGNRFGRNLYRVGGVAATLLLLVALGYGLSAGGEDGNRPVPQDTFHNPEEAYQVLRATLVEVSSTMNNGIALLAESRQEMSQVNKELKEELNKQ